MRVEVEVPVIGWGQLKTGHVQKCIFASVPRAFEIPEYEPSEVPVVLAYGQAHGNGTNSRVEYFGIGGKLYTDRMFGSDDADAHCLRYQRYGNQSVHPYFAATAERIGNTIHRLRKEGDTLLPKRVIPAAFGEFLANGRHGELFRIPTIQELGLKSHDEERVETQVAEFAKRMERMIVVGGNIFVEEQEPIIRIEGHIGSYSGTVNGWVQNRPEPTRLVDIDGWSGTSPVGFVSLADFDSLSSRVAAIEERLKKTVEFETRLVDVEIDDPRYLRASGEAVTLTAVADLLRRGFVTRMQASAEGNDAGKKRTQENLLGLDPKLLETFQKLLGALEKTTEFDVPVELEEAVGAIIRHRNHDTASMFGERKLLDYAADALQLWHDREVEFEIGVQPLRLSR
ncbi:hypothetical protein HFO56_33690 [Rhizobium laguerreae]|uniref:hypothetical protein n=1 Tax=Rhizobium laguerreae TaxID=1076926 RepID=UPI001C91C4CC|nr:hypothetical protein [Rhizobium laguerreae]MBY3157280.1 hypothetical protein [Rhizobium laguerreae]